MRINNTLFPNKSGSRKGIFTENAAFSPTNNIFKSRNQKLHVRRIFCDLAKAFDCVHHEILLTNYTFMAFKDHTQIGLDPIQLIEDKWLKLNLMTLRNRGKIKHGVHHGSILGRCFL
jgi:hypothetical protein